MTESGMNEKRKPGDGRKEQGMLYLCATPIGNLEDMTYRAVRMLREADLIAAEDTRNTIRLLNHFDIHTPMTSYHEYNKYDKARELAAAIQEGKTVVLVTDAGMPGISDPGEELVRICLDEGIRVSVVPGACACVSALAISGLPARRFCFEAFLPQQKKERQAVLEALQSETRTIVIYEAPHRLKKTLAQLYEALGERRISVCRELTKVHEEVLELRLSEAVGYYEAHEPRGEFVLVIEGCEEEQIRRSQQRAWEDMPLADHMQRYLSEGMDRKAAMKAVAKDRGVSRREIYDQVVEKK